MSLAQQNQAIQGVNEPKPQPLPEQPHNITLGVEQTQKKNNNFSDELTFRNQQNFSIQYELKTLNRQVNKITEKMKHDVFQKRNLNKFCNTSSSILYPQFRNQIHYNQNTVQNQLFKNFANINQQNQQKVGRYNYYGKKYRFQEEQQKNKINLAKDKQFDQKAQKAHKRIQQNNTFVNKIPQAQSYYIYFENPQKQRNMEFSQENQQKLSQSHNFESKNRSGATGNPLTISVGNDLKNSYPNPSTNMNSNQLRKYNSAVIQQYTNLPNSEQREGNTPIPHQYLKPQPEPRWVLQKKVKKLQKQLTEIKRKQQKKQRMNQFVNNKHKNDSKIKVGRQVQNLINSLWP